MNPLDRYRGASVLVTGSAGFVGTHLCRRLDDLGARVTHFDLVHGDDVCDSWSLTPYIEAQPRFIFHLAAQAIVREGYKSPRFTFHTNAFGTITLLEMLRRYHTGGCAVVVVTTDKVYGRCTIPVSERARLAGTCPYSASKVMAERAVESYRTAFFEPEGHRIAVATARAGNIVGPGDRAGIGRLVPDAIQALSLGLPVPIFAPRAVRPWQAIWDLVDGYVRLGAALAGPASWAYTGPFNFGPREHRTVIEVVEQVIKAWGSGTWKLVPRQLHEVDELRISSSKAALLLGWEPRWSFEDMIVATVNAYRKAQACSGQGAISST